MNTIQELFEDQIKDLHNAEKQLLKALPKMSKAAGTDSLRQAFESHLTETEEHVQRIERIAEEAGFKVSGKKCKAMEGLIEEGEEVIKEEGNGPVKDMALVAAAQRVEHYEIAAYGNARHYAEVLGMKNAAKLLQKTLDEEGAADKKLTQICEGELVQNAEKGESTNGKSTRARTASR